MTVRSGNPNQQERERVKEREREREREKEKEKEKEKEGERAIDIATLTVKHSIIATLEEKMRQHTLHHCNTATHTAPLQHGNTHCKTHEYC